MVFKVAELVATLRLDKQGYDSGLNESTQAVADLGKHAERTGSSMAGALTSGLRAASFAAVAAGTAAGVTLKKVLDTGVAYNTLQQTSRAALTTLTGSAAAANKQMDKLDAFAKTSPFSKSVFITAQQQLIGFGMAGDKVIPTLQAVNDAVAAIGGSNQDISDITLILAQIQAAGKITGQDLLQMAGHGINAAELIGKAMGKTGPEIKEAITKGTIGGQEALDALISQMGIKFEGAAANVKNTMTGASDRVKSATRDIGAALAEPFVSKNGGGRLVQWSNDWADTLRALEKRVPSVVAVFQDRLAPQLAGVSVLIQDLKAKVKGFDLSNLDAGFSKLADNLPAVAGLSGAVLALSGQFLGGVPIIGGFLAAMNPLTLAIIGATAASPELRTALGDLIGSLAPLLPAVGQLAAALSGLLSDALGATVPLVGGLGDVLGSASEVIAPLLVGISGLVSGFGDLPGPVQTVLVALGLLLLAKPALTTFFSNIGTAATTMGDKLKGASVKGAITGLLGAFGGPWGLAIGAAVVGLSLFAAENQKTKDRVEEFTASLDQNTGAITANTSTTAGKKLQEHAEAFKALRLNAKDAADAVANGGQPFVDMQNKIESLRKAAAEYNQTQGQGGTIHAEAKQRLVELAAQYGINAADATNLNQGALAGLLKTMAGLRGEVVTSSDNWKTLNQGTQDAEPVTLRLRDAIKLVGDAAGNTSDRLSAYQDIIDAMNGKTKTAEQVNRDLSKSGRDLASFFSEVDAAGKRVNGSMAIAKDGTVQFNDAGDRLSGMLDGLGDKGRAAALAAVDLAKSQGRATSAASDADKALAPFRKTLQDLAENGLLTQTQVDALSKSLFGVPGKTTAVLTDGDSAEAVKLKVDELSRTIEATPNKTVTIDEPYSPAIMDRLRTLGFQTVTLPNGKVVITHNVNSAGDALSRLSTQIDAITGKTYSIRVVASVDQVTAANDFVQVKSGKTGVPAGRYAQGAVVEMFAQGGFHGTGLTPMAPLAQIVPQNTWRVVGDNMKVPELYAPLDGSSRSISLLREGARRSGFDMVPRGATRYFAEGGMFGSAPSQAPAAAAAGGHSIQQTNHIYEAPDRDGIIQELWGRLDMAFKRAGLNLGKP